jgi:hypothetical protein
MTSDTPEIVTPELVSETTVGSARLGSVLFGSVEGAAVAELATYLESMHREALRAGAAQVVVDLRALDFVSAAGLRAFTRWVGGALRDGAYAVSFACDPNKPWQRRAFEPIASSCGDRVQLV